MRNARGFTLIELLIAILIFTVLYMLAYGGLDNLLNTQARSEERAEALRELQLAYRVMARDLEQAVPRAITDEFGQSREALVAGDSIDYLLELTRGGWRNPAEQTRSTLQRVAFGLEDKTLHRYVWLTLDRTYDALPRKQALLTGVSEMQFRMLDESGSWHQRWPLPGNTVKQIKVIEVTIKTEQWGELRWLFRAA